MQSCKLESELYNAINPTIYPTTARDARDLVTSNAYGVFKNGDYNGLFNVATGIILTTEIATDYGFCSWDDKGVWERLAFPSWTALDTRNATHGWDFINNLSKMTLTIDRISGIEMDETLKKQYTAELRCGRGFLAFWLYDLFGPLIIADLETLKNPAAVTILPRLSDEETRAFIVTELTEAAKDLPYNYDKGSADHGRFTKGLCHMILLKFYMQTKQWDKAITEGRELMNPAYGYALVTTPGGAGNTAYENIFTFGNEKNAETIWAVNNLEGTQTHLWYPHVLPSNYGPFKNQGWGGYKMTWDFFKTFEEGDQRKSGIIYEYTSSTTGELYNEANKGEGPNSLAQGVFPLKYALETNVGDHCQTDWIIYRYADALTLLSEALVRQSNAVSQEAVDLLDRVRTRAGLNAYGSPAAFSGARDFLDKLLLERAHEFYFEGCRRQDLIRDGSYVQIMNAKCLANGRAQTVSEKHHLFPLKEALIIEGQGIIKQNPGY
jgi:hypothetical protein